MSGANTLLGGRDVVDEYVGDVDEYLGASAYPAGARHSVASTDGTEHFVALIALAALGILAAMHFGGIHVVAGVTS